MVEAAVRLPLERRARALAWLGLAWHAAEFVVAVGAGVAAGSIALIGFGVDSLIEALAGLVVLWLFPGRRLGAFPDRRWTRRNAVKEELRCHPRLAA